MPGSYARMYKRLLYTVLPILACSLGAYSQAIAIKEPAAGYPFINTLYNRVFNSGPLDSFYKKLYTLHKTGTGTIRVVHIGDSHVQGDFLSAVVREGLQSYFGNAGRGLVFPYRLAGSNAPADIVSAPGVGWQYNRIAHPEIAIAPGISGFVIRTASPAAAISLSLRPSAAGPQTFTRLRFFIDSSSAWLLQAENNETPCLVKMEEGDSSAYVPVALTAPAGSFILSSLPGERIKEFYGVSLENDHPGVLWHTIGVNGARYDQYNIASRFWQQLPALQADLYIVSLGTNEAQRAAFGASAFESQVTLFLQRLKSISPGAAILITTAPDSYKGKGSNQVLRQLSSFLAEYCNRQAIPLWDLYRVGGGYGSAYRWIQKGLMTRDRVHFTVSGYRLQGALLWQALASGYNSYAASRP